MNPRPPEKGEAHDTVPWAPGRIDRLPMTDIMALTEDFAEIARHGALTARAARILGKAPPFDGMPVAPGPEG